MKLLNTILKSFVESSSQTTLESGVLLYLDSVTARYGERSDNFLKEIKPVLYLLVEVLDNKVLSDITYKDTSLFFKTIQRLPSNRNKKLPKLTVSQQIKKAEKTGFPLLSPRTVNKYMEVCSTFFSFLSEIGEIERNLFSSKILRVPEHIIPRDQRKAFNKSDLKLIFEKGKYFGGGQKNKFFKNIYFWGTLIALLSGLRLNEIAQLHTSDIQKIDGIWCIVVDVTRGLKPKEDNYKKLKNKSSIRTVPIHDVLIDLGFLNFVEEVKKTDSVRLFPEIKKKKKGGYGAIFGEWFNKNKKSYFEIDDPKKTFHSFRHTIANSLKQASVPEHIASSILGHEITGETYTRYGKQYEPKVLKKQGIDKIKFHIDWVMLKKGFINPWYEMNLKTA